MSAFDVFLGRPTQWVASLPRRAPHTRLPRAQAPYLEPRPPAPRLPERHWLAHPRPRRARTHRRRVSLMCARDGLSRSAAWAACDRPCGRSAAAICCRAPSHGGTWRRSLSATGVGFKVSRGPLVPGAAPAGPADQIPPSVAATRSARTAPGRGWRCCERPLDGAEVRAGGRWVGGKCRYIVNI